VTDEPPISRRAAREAADAASRRRPVRAAGPAAASSGDQATELLGTASDDAPRRGIGALVAKHPTAWLAGAIGVVFLLLGTGAVFAGVAVGSQSAPAPVVTATPDPPRPLPDLELAASRLRTCSVAGPAADGRLMSLYGQVIRADSGEVLFDRGADSPQRTASVLKVVTAATALQVLGPDYTIKTSVYASPTPGTIVLVGRGDATLSRLPPGAESVYRGAPKLADLAAATLAQYDGPEITSIVLDATYWSAADKWDSSWKRSEQTQGYHSEVTALQVDGDRSNPQAQDSPRSTDPIARAGALFLEALRAADTDDEVADDVTFSNGSALGGQALLAEVQSQPVKTLITYMLQVSDNTLAEMLARISSKQGSLNGSASSLQGSVQSALTALGVPTTGITIRDGSGLSDLNAVPPATMNALLQKIVTGDPALAPIIPGMPVAGQSGTLASRFTGDNAEARGAVVAKTGWIDTGYSLGGWMTARDGTVLVFTFYALGEGIQGDARQALDSLATAVFRCGDNLSNN
jgi:serine-type D-Ala-D-Ala carboxypeptidase/endopeptidase (penicillin-binding protein 4)